MNQSTSHTVGHLLVNTEKLLRDSRIPDPQIDSKWLLATSLACKPADLIMKREQHISPAELKLFQGYVARRLKREPLQYILGETEFWGLRMKVSPKVLVPRHETELLVEQAIKIVGTQPYRILDIGTGSGCIAIALAHALPQISMTATDICPDSIALARENALINKVTRQIEFIETDIYPPRNTPPFDMIVANPPYVSEGTWNSLQEEIRFYEPKGAIVSGPTGLEIIERILDEAWPYLKPGGPLIMEIGDDEREAVFSLIQKRPLWEDCIFKPDYQKIDRLVIVQRKQNG